MAERRAEVAGDRDHQAFRVEHPPAGRAQQKFGVSGDRPARVEAADLAHAGDPREAYRHDARMQTPGIEFRLSDARCCRLARHGHGQGENEPRKLRGVRENFSSARPRGLIMVSSHAELNADVLA